MGALIALLRKIRGGNKFPKFTQHIVGDERGEMGLQMLLGWPTVSSEWPNLARLENKAPICLD